MTKKLGILLTVGSLGALCAGLCACSDDNKREELFENGYTITVKYDSSGGEILNSDSVSIEDLFNPDKCKADAEGYIHIKLREPTDPNRKYNGKIGNTPMSITRSGYCLVGWYKTRTEAKNEQDEVIDEEGHALKYNELDAYYYYETVNDKDQTEQIRAVPKYVYSEPWDFENDRIDYKRGGEKLEMTLYAAWAKPFTFEYYYETQSGKWESFGSTSFDPAKAEKDGDLKKAFLPTWSTETGRMEHRHGDYEFPKVSGKTFDTAYADEACSTPISEFLEHEGEIDRDTATAKDPVQKIYVKFLNGNHYRISTAKQFADIGDAAGIYTITQDLDFNYQLKNGRLNFARDSAAVRWPQSLMTGEFKGKLQGEEGKPIVFNNVGAKCSSTTGFAGLFGSIGADAQIENVSFNNVFLEVESATNRNGVSVGMFAGEIEDEATLTNVSVGGKLCLLDIDSPVKKVNLTANSNRDKVTLNGASVIVYGTKVRSTDSKYTYNVDFNNTTVNAANGEIAIVLFDKSNSKLPLRQFDDQEQEIYNSNGGN